MTKRKPKTKEQVRLETRFAIFVVYVIYNLAFVFMAMKSNYIANNITNLMVLNVVLTSLIMLWSFDLKNIIGWWNKQWFIRKQRALHRQEIKARLERERGLGYDSIPR